MQNELPTYKLVVTSGEVGVIVEVNGKDAIPEIKKAREFLGSLIATPKLRAQATPIPKQMARSLSQRILSLGVGFFTQPREASEVMQHLARGGFHYQIVDVRRELLRMVKRGQLRRVGDGTKSSAYRYVNQ